MQAIRLTKAKFINQFVRMWLLACSIVKVHQTPPAEFLVELHLNCHTIYTSTVNANEIHSIACCSLLLWIRFLLSVEVLNLKMHCSLLLKLPACILLCYECCLLYGQIICCIIFALTLWHKKENLYSYIEKSYNHKKK